MNDLEDMRERWGQPEPPSPAAYSAARAALLDQVAATRAAAPARARLAVAQRGQRPSGGAGAGWSRRRASWLAGGLGLTAAAATVAVAITAISPGAATGSRAAGRPAAVSRLSGRQILLAAAASAAAGPAAIGKYWYVKQAVTSPDGGPSTLQDWYTHDGTEYHLAPGGTVVYRATLANGFPVGASVLTLGEVRQLPASPAALTAWLTRSFTHPVDDVPTPATAHPAPRAVYSPPSGASMPGDVAVALVSLLYQVPAPPAVRAAAFRALAAMPDVTKAGQAGHSVRLRISLPRPPASKYPDHKVPAGAGEITVTIGTSALILRAWSDYEGRQTILTARWTDHLPTVVPASQLFPHPAHPG